MQYSFAILLKHQFQCRNFTCRVVLVLLLKRKSEIKTSPLHTLLQLPLLADLWELFLIVLSHLALLGSTPWVVFDALNFFLPRLHQLVVALAKFLFLKAHRQKKSNTMQIHENIFYCLPFDLQTQN